MRRRYFISDLHLNEHQPAITAGFLHFLSQLPAQSDLYILGDFFDYWVGDDLGSPLQQQILTALQSLAERHIHLYFLCGNRDFLVGKSFAKSAHLTLLPDVYKIEGTQIVLLHGDLLCTDDRSYQRFRTIIHQPWLQRLFLALPRWIRLKIAHRLRHKSQNVNQYKSNHLMDVVQESVARLMVEKSARIMVHGHTHQPKVSLFEEKGISRTRWVLGAWHDSMNYLLQDSQGEWCYVTSPLPSMDHTQSQIQSANEG